MVASDMFGVGGCVQLNEIGDAKSVREFNLNQSRPFRIHINYAKDTSQHFHSMRFTNNIFYERYLSTKSTLAYRSQPRCKWPKNVAGS